ncbi:MAG: D-2-hydroxyacid dehydrogenase [Alphaproteobacteria bacterium]
MPSTPLAPKESLTIGFAHAAYRLGDEFARRNTGIRHFEVRTLDDLKARMGEADVLVVSGLWRNELLELAPKLRFIQSISAGVDQYARDKLQARQVRLASAQGANERAVAEHAIALILALSRHIAWGRDNQARRHWRPMISDLARREDELGGKTLLIVGLGRIGQRLAHLAKAFDMRVVGLRRDPSAGGGEADQVLPTSKLLSLLPEADVVALTCPLTPETENIIDARALAAMKPSAHLVNVARGRCVDEAALIAALHNGQLAAAALDCVREEPLPESSPLWAIENVLITPHTGGETRRYESRIVDLLLDNLDRLWRGETTLKNQIV